MTHLTPEFVAKSLGVYLPSLMSPEQDPSLAEPFTEISTDTRSIKPGSLFIAIKGEKLDGHEYITQALEKGARGVICAEGTPPPSFRPIKVFQVKDTLEAFRKLAFDWRSQFNIPVIGVCGSVGKTTTKELLTSVLKGKFESVLKTEGSQNGYLGIPITLMALRDHHEAAVIEIGIDEPGAMKEHIKLVRPTHAIVTALGPEHLEKLIDLETVAREESRSLSMTAEMGGKILVNLDEPGLTPHLTETPKSARLGYHLATKNHGALSAKELKNLGHAVIEGTTDGTSLTYELMSALPTATTETTSQTLHLPLPGEHHARNLLGAVAVSLEIGLTAGEIAKGLELFQGATGRTEIYELTSPVPAVFLCDYYNANPTSMEAAFTVLNELASKANSPRKLVCLGDMLELGQGERQMHEALAQSLVKFSMSDVFLYGPRMKWLEHALENQGFKGMVAHFETHTALTEALLNALKPNDTVLIKGSRSMKMEKVWNEVTHGAVSYRKRS